jgi:hypothetical protein
MAQCLITPQHCWMSILISADALHFYSGSGRWRRLLEHALDGHEESQNLLRTIVFMDESRAYQIYFIPLHSNSRLRTAYSGISISEHVDRGPYKSIQSNKNVVAGH